MSPQQLRELVKGAYPHSAAWKTKVKNMPDHQITAIFFRLKREGKI